MISHLNFNTEDTSFFKTLTIQTQYTAIETIIENTSLSTFFPINIVLAKGKRKKSYQLRTESIKMFNNTSVNEKHWSKIPIKLQILNSLEISRPSKQENLLGFRSHTNSSFAYKIPLEGRWRSRLYPSKAIQLSKRQFCPPPVWHFHHFALVLAHLSCQ